MISKRWILPNELEYQVRDWYDWDRFEYEESMSPEALKVMLCIQKFGLTLEEWRNLEREDQLIYLYGITGISTLERREAERRNRQARIEGALLIERFFLWS